MNRGLRLPVPTVVRYWTLVLYALAWLRITFRRAKPANATVWEPDSNRNREQAVSRKQEVRRLTFFDVFAWLVVLLLASMAVGIIVFLGLWPGRVARTRNHPWADAIAIASFDTHPEI